MPQPDVRHIQRLACDRLEAGLPIGLLEGRPRRTALQPIGHGPVPAQPSIGHRPGGRNRRKAEQSPHAAVVGPRMRNECAAFSVGSTATRSGASNSSAAVVALRLSAIASGDYARLRSVPVGAKAAETLHRAGPDKTGGRDNVVRSDGSAGALVPKRTWPTLLLPHPAPLATLTF